MKAVELHDIGKKYILKFEKRAIMKDVIPRLFRPKVEVNFWALRNINLAVNQGESIGIIGANGSGKTTLLSIIANITFPTEGKIKIQGRLSTLLTLGAGFHMELTGIDNILLNGIILGMKLEEIEQKLPDIIAFSELGQFINQPFYTYSAGMMLRLGFSVAVFVDFDILIIDEILSVGDMHFQNKCLPKIDEFRKQGKTLIIASQSMDQISSLCDRVLFLEKGRIQKVDKPSEVISYYQHKLKQKKFPLQLKAKKENYALDRDFPQESNKIKLGWGEKFENKKAKILDVKLAGENEEKNIFNTGELLKIIVKYQVNQTIENPHFGVAIFRDDYLYCYGPNTNFDNIKIKKLKRGVGEFNIQYKNLPLTDGKYKISAAIWEKQEKYAYDHHYAFYDLNIQNNQKLDGLVKILHYWVLNSEKRIEGEIADNNIKTWIRNQREIHPIENNSAKIIECKITDKTGKTKQLFITGEMLKISIHLSLFYQIKNIKIWSAIYREDGILCHQSLINPVRKNIPDSVKILLVYPNLPFMNGDYYFLLGVWNEQFNQPLALTVRNFTIYSNKKDHGIVYLEHKWNINLPT